jgi:large subunit ribosomal protein L24
MLNIKKNDLVVVLSGKDKGKKGKVLDVLHKQAQVIVQQINIITKHIKPRKRQGQVNGKICNTEAAIHVSKVMIICPHCKESFRIKYNISKESRKRIRVCRGCGAMI